MAEVTAAPSVTFDDNPVIKETILPNYRLEMNSDVSLTSPEPNRPDGDSMTSEEEKKDAEDAEDEEVDHELIRNTQSNRVIKHSESPPNPKRRLSVRRLPAHIKDFWLVFSDHSTSFQSSDRITVKNHYGAGLDGKLDVELKPTRRPRSYLIACDFSVESIYALNWTMGSMLRDGDTLHVVTIVEKKSNANKRTALLAEASKNITEKTKNTLGKMLLFDVSLMTYAICGKVKVVLTQLIKEFAVDMVVCGCKKENKLKGLFSDPVSTFLIETSRIPVTIVKHKKNKERPHNRPVRAASLSQSVQSGQLAVDELSKSSRDVK